MKKESMKTPKAPKKGGDGMKVGGKPKRGAKQHGGMSNITRQMVGRGGIPSGY